MCVEKRCFEFDRGKDNVIDCNEFNIYVYVLYKFVQIFKCVFIFDEFLDVFFCKC